MTVGKHTFFFFRSLGGPSADGARGIYGVLIADQVGILVPHVLHQARRGNTATFLAGDEPLTNCANEGSVGGGSNVRARATFLT
jgi:hypothetical protein